MTFHSLPHRPALWLAFSAALWPLSACTVGGSSTVAAENDRLRREVVELNTQVKSLEAEKAELTAKLASGGSLSPEAAAALPALASLELGSLCGYTPTDPAKPATGIDIYLEPRDGRGRFVQAVGTLRVRILPAGEGSAAGAPLAQVTLSPLQLRDAYRSAFTGTHYTVSVPLAPPRQRVAATIRAELTDAISGTVYTAEHPIGPRP